MIDLTTIAKDMERPMIDKVKDLQSEMLKMPQYQPETRHYFHGGMYCREVFRHAGVLIVGCVHKKEHFYVVASGTIRVTTDEGVTDITGPAVICSNPGTKRAVYAVTDATCMTFHRLESTTLEEAEKELVEPEPTKLFDSGNRLKDNSSEVIQ